MPTRTQQLGLLILLIVFAVYVVARVGSWPPVAEVPLEVEAPRR